MKNWKKYLATFLVCGILAVSAGSAFAAGAQEQMFYEAGVYTGNLYFCDSERQTVVLTDVAPVSKVPSETEKTTALEAEYEELMLSAVSLKLPDGSLIAMTELNNYADSKVRVVIARSAVGLRVLSITFL